ncbi:MAG TPA: hypothetical protein VFD52_04740 [Clostridia bacterium]|nr:hypothetical protein [Clostridia bacterium]
MENERREINISVCPFCNGREFALGIQGGYATISPKGSAFRASAIEHLVCLTCGSIVNSRVKRIRPFRRSNKKTDLY